MSISSTGGRRNAVFPKRDLPFRVSVEQIELISKASFRQILGMESEILWESENTPSLSLVIKYSCKLS
jgi:hypothetical protein